MLINDFGINNFWLIIFKILVDNLEINDFWLIIENDENKICSYQDLTKAKKEFFSYIIKKFDPIK